MKLFVNWIRYIFCDFDMFADWKSFGWSVNGLLGIIIIDNVIMSLSLGCIESIALTLILHSVIAVTDATQVTASTSTIAIIRLSITAMHTICRQINWTGIEVSLLCDVANVIIGDFLHLISSALRCVCASIIVCTVFVAARRIVANVERLLRVCRWRHMTQITSRYECQTQQ